MRRRRSKSSRKRVGGATYQVPVEVKCDRRMALAMRWLLVSARGRGGKPMYENMASEIMDADNNTGAAVKRKEETTKWRRPTAPSLITALLGVERYHARGNSV